MAQAGYIDVTDIAAYEFQKDLSTNPALFDKLIPRASRLFDMLCGVDPGYFSPVGYPVWRSLHEYAVGDVITPRTSNGHRYEVTTAGKSGASEPSYPTGSGATVTNGDIVLTERGTDVVAATEKVVYGSGNVMLALPPHVGEIVSVVPGSGFVLPFFVEQSGYLKVVDSLGRTQDVGVPYAGGGLLGNLQGGLAWQRGAPFTVTAVWGFAADDLRLELVKQGTMELLIALFRSKDPAFLQAVQLDSNQMFMNPAIPKRARIAAASFRNARPSTSAFV